MQMQSGAGSAFQDSDCGLTYNAFGRGSTVFVFDLTADLSNGFCSEPTRRGGL